MGGDNPSAVEKHIERTEWLRHNLATVLDSLGIGSDQTGNWKVEASVVVSHELMTPYILPVPIPVLSFRELLAGLDASAEPHRRRRSVSRDNAVI